MSPRLRLPVMSLLSPTPLHNIIPLYTDLCSRSKFKGQTAMTKIQYIKSKPFKNATMNTYVLDRIL